MAEEDKKNLTEEEKVREELAQAKAKCEEYYWLAYYNFPQSRQFSVLFHVLESIS